MTVTDRGISVFNRGMEYTNFVLHSLNRFHQKRRSLLLN